METEFGKDPFDVSLVFTSRLSFCQRKAIFHRIMNAADDGGIGFFVWQPRIIDLG